MVAGNGSMKMLPGGSAIVCRCYASDPPTQSVVQSVIYKLNELIEALDRQA